MSLLSLPVGQRPTQATISCVIPALNECHNLQQLLPELEQLFAQEGLACELIVVDDGSSDGTAIWAQSWPGKTPRRYLQLSRNFGKEAALSAGLQVCRGDAVILLDADLQHPPQLIKTMLTKWQAGVDMVYATRSHRQDESSFKRWGSRFFYRLMGQGHRFAIPPNAGDFRLMDRLVVNALLQLPERTRFMKGLYAWVGFTTEAVEYQPLPRQYGQSHFNRLKLIKLALDGITAFSTGPLTALTLIGATLAGLAIAYSLYIVAEYVLIGNPVSGWVTLATSILFFSGVNLFGMGLLGTYIGRIFDEVKQRPLYVIRHDSGQPTEGERHV